MDFQFSEDQQAIREAARDFAQAQVKPRAHAIDEAERPPDGLLREMGRLGFLGMCVPEAYGGIGADTLSFVIAVEEIARASAAMSAFLVLNNALVGEALRLYGEEMSKRHWLERLAEGTCLGALAVAEPDDRAELDRLDTTAVLEDRGYRLDGHKTPVVGGGIADVVLVLAHMVPAERAEPQPSLFLVPAGTEGLTTGERQRTMGLRGAAVTALRLSGCVVPAARLLGKRGQGAEILRAVSGMAHIGAAAQVLGLAEAACQEAVAYAGDRRQFGQPIGRFQGIAFMLAEMQTAVEAARYLVYYAAWLRDRQQEIRVPAARARFHAAAAAHRVVDAALQIHGGYGYIKEYPVERYFRDVRTLEVLYGTPDAQKHVMAEPFLGERTA